jgi:putative PIN family toxin of toxin-antitoxin system
MGKPRVLLDTNIIVSGLVFAKGNEHRILRLVEDRRIGLVLPESVLLEAKRVLAERFPGFEVLLDLFLSRIEFEKVPVDSILLMSRIYENEVRDPKDATLYAAVILARPDYVVTGDKDLRFDLNRSPEIVSKTKACSSKELLDEFDKDQ